MNQVFLEKLDTAGYDKELLVKLMAEIDEQKRSVRSALSRLSSEPDHQFAAGKERQTLIRRMKDKSSFLTEQREIVRNRLGEIKTNKRIAHEINNGKKDSFAAAFMVAARELLTEEQLLDIESRALVISQQLS